ncbi:MAG: LytTR family DNA-binding domain-containing protein [Bacteroidales bacterium]|nr:LytTR family DNA-binding domain-containing protein [Bacteroidales bacterium]
MFRAIIIDDEFDSRNTIQNILQNYCENISVVAHAENVKQGIQQIRSEKPDVVFLDIQMPDGTGFNLLEELEQINFQVIFVTAFDQYALKAIKFSALDYILKPVDPQQLIDAVAKLKTPEINFETVTNKINTLLVNKKGFERISLPTFEGYRFISIKDIIRCEADNNYTYFRLQSGENILVTKTLKEYDETLSGNDFVRVHQSHLVNMNFVSRYLKGDGGTIIMSDGSEVEVSRRRKEEFLRRMNA